MSLSDRVLNVIARAMEAAQGGGCDGLGWTLLGMLCWTVAWVGSVVLILGVALLMMNVY